MHFPILLSVCSLLALGGVARLGCRFAPASEAVKPDLNLVLASTLSMLGLIVGFTFAMSISRYDERKHLEAAETNAIGTEYLRIQLLPPGDTLILKGLIRHYLDCRIADYTTEGAQPRARLRADTDATQQQLWEAAKRPTLAKVNIISSLVLQGMNNMLDSRGYAEAARQNHIPTPAWVLMEIIALMGCFMVGQNLHSAPGNRLLLWVVPLVMATAFLLIADIDQPQRGLIKIHPENLELLAQSLQQR